MKDLVNKTKQLFLSLLIVTTLFVSLQPAKGACAPNVVPSPLDPNCTLNQPLTVGTFVNRAVGLLPLTITLIAIVAMLRAAFKIMFADSAEKRSEGFSMVYHIALGAGLFYSLWLILFLIEFFTGAKVNVFS